MAGCKKGPSIYLVTDTSNMASYSTPYYITPTLKGLVDETHYTRNIVMLFKDSTDSTARAGLMAAYHLSLVQSTESFELYKVMSGDALQVSKAIYETGLVNYCHPDFYVIARPASIPFDSFFNKQWYLHNTAQGTNDGKSTTDDADIDAPEAWDITKGSAGVVIAVIDEGVTSNHEDLPNTRQIRLFGSNFGVGYDGSTNKNDPSPILRTDTGFNHGNACAGIIGAEHNNFGIAGIAPLCRIMPIKVPLTFSAPVSVYASAIEFARTSSPRANIINMSFGRDPFFPSVAEETAIQNAITANISVVISTGNTANRATGDIGYVEFPANVSIDEVLTVGASDRNNKVADYSPNSSDIELVAPSHTAYNKQIPGESFNIWTIDIPTDSFGYNKWPDTVAKLPLKGEFLPAGNGNYTGRFGGTSAAVPQVAGVIALMRTRNACLKLGRIRDILQSTADKIGSYDYNYIDKYNYGLTKSAGYSKELGYGKLNAYGAVRAVDLDAGTNTNDKLYIKDSPSDIGLTGTYGTGSTSDKSPDIWVRNTNDGLTNQWHENPEFTVGGKCYVYVRVRNKMCTDFYPPDYPGTTPQISLYWSKASTWSGWPANWNGSDPTVGSHIETKNLPRINAGETAIIQFEWTMVNPHVFKTWNSCLLAQFSSSSDGVVDYPGRLDQYVSQNNNVALRNLTIVDSIKGVLGGGRVLAGNIDNVAKVFNLRFLVPDIDKGRPDISSEAEVKLSFDAQGWGIMQQSGQLNQPGIKILPNNQLLISKPDVTFSNVSFPANTRIPIDVQFNFLCDSQTNNLRYDYEMSQAFADTPDMVLGTESFEIYKAVRTPFHANAGPDVTINKGSSITLTATQINDSAQYNWYDEQDNLLGTGLNFVASPLTDKTYTLEVISLVDGFKDYDQVSVTVRQYFITSLSPNPATTQVSVGYDATNATTASLLFLLPNGTTYSSHALNPAQSQAMVNTSQFPPGIYNVVLQCDGQSVDAKSLQIN